MSVEAAKETLEFQTEARQILQLMTHSLYSNKEIFLRELISNASDACDKLRFEALGDDSLYDGDSDLSILVEYDDEAKTISITDNGVGMSKEVIKKAFDPMFTTKDKGKGTGLGLAICKDIVERYHGRITAENAPRGGSVFTVYLPTASNS